MQLKLRNCFLVLVKQSRGSLNAQADFGYTVNSPLTCFRGSLGEISYPLVLRAPTPTQGTAIVNGSSLVGHEMRGEKFLEKCPKGQNFDISSDFHIFISNLPLRCKNTKFGMLSFYLFLEFKTAIPSLFREPFYESMTRLSVTWLVYFV